MLILILIFAFYLSCFLFSLLFLGGGVVGWRGCVCFFSYPIDFLAGWQDVFTWLFRKNPSLTKFPKEVDGVGRSHFIRLRTYQIPPHVLFLIRIEKFIFKISFFFLDVLCSSGCVKWCEQSVLKLARAKKIDVHFFNVYFFFFFQKDIVRLLHMIFFFIRLLFTYQIIYYWFTSRAVYKITRVKWRGCFRRSLSHLEYETFGVYLKIAEREDTNIFYAGDLLLSRRNVIF